MWSCLPVIAKAGNTFAIGFTSQIYAAVVNYITYGTKVRGRFVYVMWSQGLFLVFLLVLRISGVSSYKPGIFWLMAGPLFVFLTIKRHLDHPPPQEFIANADHQSHVFSLVNNLLTTEGNTDHERQYAIGIIDCLVHCTVVSGRGISLLVVFYDIQWPG